MLTLIYLIADYFRDHPDVFDGLRELGPYEITMLIALHLVAIALQALRSLVVLTPFSKNRIPYPSWLRIFVIGRVLSIVASQAGTLYRAYAAKRQFGVLYTHYTAAIALYMWLDIGMTLMFTVALRAMVPASTIGDDLTIGILITTTIIWLFAAPTGSMLIGGLLLLDFVPARLRTRFRAFVDGFWATARNRLVLLRVLSLGLMSFINLIVMILLVFRVQGVDLEPYQAAILIAIYKLSQSVIITPGNVGVREWSIGGACVVMGIDPGLGLLFSLVMRAAHLVALGGALGVIGIHAGAARLKRLTTCEKRAR